MHTHTGARVHMRTGMRVCIRAYMCTCTRTHPHTKSQKVRRKRPKSRPPVAISSRFGRAAVSVKWVYYPNPPHMQFNYLCSMTIEIHNRLPIGLNVGFEFYSDDDFGGPQDFYELHINLLFIKIVFFWDK